MIYISKKNDIGYRNAGMNTGKIMYTEEYEAYQDNLREKALPRVSSVKQSQNRYNRNYFRPDDDY